MDAREALDILDLTLLDLNASESELDELCRLANLHRPASVCVFSEHVSYVAERLKESQSVLLLQASQSVAVTRSK